MVLARGHAVIPPVGGVRRRAGARTGAAARDPPAPRPPAARPSDGFGREELQVGAVRAAVRLNTAPGPAQPFGTPEQAAFQRPGDPTGVPPGPLARILDETRLQADATAVRTSHRIHRTSLRTTRPAPLPPTPPHAPHAACQDGGEQQSCRTAPAPRPEPPPRTRQDRGTPRNFRPRQRPAASANLYACPETTRGTHPRSALLTTAGRSPAPTAEPPSTAYGWPATGTVRAAGWTCRCCRSPP